MKPNVFLSLFEQANYQFVLPLRRKHSGDKLVWVNPTFDTAWRRESMYVGTKGSGESIKGRYEGFLEWRKKGIPIEVSEVHVDKNGEVYFINGRHRYAVLKDDGMPDVPVAMDPEAIKNAEKFGYLAHSP